MLGKSKSRSEDRDPTSQQIVLSLDSLSDRTGSGTSHPVVKERALLSCRKANRQSLTIAIPLLLVNTLIPLPSSTGGTCPERNRGSLCPCSWPTAARRRLPVALALACVPVLGAQPRSKPYIFSGSPSSLFKRRTSSVSNKEAPFIEPGEVSPLSTG